MTVTSLPRFALLAVCVPIALAGCSGSSSSTNGPTPDRPSASAASPTPFVTPPVATSYVVTADKGTSDADLKAAATPLAKLPGVVGVSLIGRRQLRVDLGNDQLKDNGAALFAALSKLGAISVPN